MEGNRENAWTERSKAINRAMLRGAVAGYLVYLGGSIVYDLIQGTTSMSPVVGWIIGPVFVIAGAGFGWITWRRWKADEKEVQALTKEADAPEASEQDDPTEST